MDERTMRNSFAMAKLQEAMSKRNEVLNRQKDDQVKIGMNEQECNFIRNQRVRAYEEAARFCKDKPLVEVLECAQQIFEFFVADGVYELSDPLVITRM